MNISNEIIKKMKKGHGLIDIICELVEGSDEIDYHDVAEVIKENPTMLATLEHEFKGRRMIKPDTNDLNLTDIFKEI